MQPVLSGAFSTDSLAAGAEAIKAQEAKQESPEDRAKMQAELRDLPLALADP